MTKHLSRIFTILVFFVLYAPLLVMVLFSFNAGKSTSVFSGFSLYWYKELFSSSDTMTALQNTLVLAVASAVACLWTTSSLSSETYLGVISVSVALVASVEVVAGVVM